MDKEEQRLVVKYFWIKGWDAKKNPPGINKHT
jgi:hypothetical protein